MFEFALDPLAQYLINILSFKFECCSIILPNVERLSDHLPSAHGIAIKKEVKHFQECMEWKVEEDMRKHSLYVQHLGACVRGVMKNAG